MTGVEILATQEVATAFTFNWTASFIIFGVIFTIFILIGFSMTVYYDDLRQIIVGLIIGTIFGVVFGGVFGSGLETPTEYETQYKVTISDEVLMNDFLEHYEIVDQEGKIYTVRERD